ncbi:hypothetical protein ART_1649 [Arthrobacter sp. PAMC 25486]|uniref:glycosyltransferase n=1 Tax=Arthrobacter sp. PAMC 25486 TaxID=1494608 RepID=UPI000535C988|nr:glycosyltransferase [Arthrobacter sp. PAMC 25486]AIY01248.1 hypothetical protein ART_1649 [Arthrobacter sp. PAMC 25486]
MNFISEPHDVDIVIAVHQLTRPIERAVLSALAAGSPGQVRVIVVGHGLESDDLWSVLGGCPSDHVHVVKHVDGIRSAAGPFNAGLQAATAEFVGVMGSDDLLEPGSISSWVAQARQDSADAIVAPLRFQSGPMVRTPRLRALRRSKLDPVRDRLAYRTAPLGIIRMAVVQTQTLAFTEGMATGEDVSFSLRLWFGGARIAMGYPGKSYIIGEDAQDRVTQRRLPLDEEFAAFSAVLEERWFHELSASGRRSIAVKIARIHVIPAVSGRGAEWDWTGSDGMAVHHLLAELDAAAAGYAAPLSRADRALLEAAAKLPANARSMGEALNNYGRASRSDRLLTQKLAGNFLVESNARYFFDLKLAHGLARWTPRWAA